MVVALVEKEKPASAILAGLVGIWWWGLMV